MLSFLGFKRAFERGSKPTEGEELSASQLQMRNSDKGDKRSNGPWAVLVPNGVKASTAYGYSHLSYYNMELHHGQDNAVTSGKTEVLETNRVKREKGTG